jgi:hypothetical protein
MTGATTRQPAADQLKIAVARMAAMDLIVRRTRAAVDLARARPASRACAEGLSQAD